MNMIEITGFNECELGPFLSATFGAACETHETPCQTLSQESQHPLCGPFQAWSASPLMVGATGGST